MSWGSSSRGAHGHDRVHRLAIRSLTRDPRSDALTAEAHALGSVAVHHIDVVDLVFVRGALTAEDKTRLAAELLVDPLLQTATWGTDARADERRFVETALLPGVTDSVAAEIVRAAGLLGIPVDAAATGRRYEIDGPVNVARWEGAFIFNAFIRLPL